ncbi:restriction endonuclease subunit S [Klebsiella sp. R19]|uniref:restriction endonuclease subunit S n=1 Tax=Klebsiella sp. R19 TaxID=3409956 RepID=UPI0029890BBE|nr:restriction endonuclease subunit S [Klebsiella pneumoniae]HBT3294428.1 hypothetical protein [Klebsiella aerogenes]HBR7410898.1 restriction endonuclease subunit S [Klebsiella pneumoniae]HBR7420550.1 restriction endonuclease subunit S [Klebsiella pneumoniae]HBW2294058.1 hypothetical protein [Klebsiella pneumoniae]
MVNNIINVRNGNTTPVGFKHTEIGIFPKDWEVVPLVNICKEIGDGIHATPIYSESGEYYFINGNNISNGKVFTDDNTKKVNESEFLKHQKKLTKKTILLSINGTIGNTAFYKEERLVLGKSAAYLTIKDNTSEEFIYYIIQTSQTKKQFDDGMTGSTIKNLGLATIRKTIVPLPTIEEQTAIASALSDTDALINALEQLIAKKQAIKTATMQHLLTGRTRLPQFAKHPDGTLKDYKSSELGLIPEDWKATTIKELTKNIIDYRGRTPKKLGMDWGGGNILALSAGNVKKGFIDFQSENYFGSYELYKKWMVAGDVQKDDIVFTMEAPLGNAALIPNDDKYILSQRTILLQVNREKYNPRLVIQIFLTNHFQEYIANSATGSTAQGIKRSIFEKLSVVLPACLQEQTAIATILSDMDAELSVLEQKLTKVHDIKKGMMQQLLTGRIRLPLDHQP